MGVSMNFKETIARLRALGVPDSAIPGVMEMLDEREEDARRPRTGTERSRSCRDRKRNDDATKTLPDRADDVAPALQKRCETVAPAPPLACAFSTGEEVSILPLEKPSVSIPKGTKQKSDPRSRGCRLPEDWRPNDDGRRLAVELLGNGGAHAELTKFLDFWQAKAGPNARKVDWDAAWRGWVRRSEENKRGPPAGAVTTRNGKPSVQDFARLQDEQINGTLDDMFGEHAGDVRSHPPRLLSSR